MLAVGVASEIEATSSAGPGTQCDRLGPVRRDFPAYRRR